MNDRTIVFTPFHIIEKNQGGNSKRKVGTDRDLQEDEVQSFSSSHVALRHTDRRIIMSSGFFHPMAVYRMVLDMLGIEYQREYSDDSDANVGNDDGGNTVVADTAQPPTWQVTAAPPPSTSPTTTAPSYTPTGKIPSSKPSSETILHCGCVACTDDIWNRDAYGMTCGARIEYMETPRGGAMNEARACEIVSNQYPTRCGYHRCNPLICDGSLKTL